MDGHQHLGYELLRLSSTPSSPLGSFSETGPGKVRPDAEGFEARKFGSRFMGFGSSNMLEEKLKESPAVSPRQYSGLPPQYPRPSSVFSSSAMEGSYGTVGSTAMDHHQSQPKLNSPNLARLSSSPPGLFSHLSAQNGKLPVLHGSNDADGLQAFISHFSCHFPAITILDLTAVIDSVISKIVYFCFTFILN